MHAHHRGKAPGGPSLLVPERPAGETERAHGLAESCHGRIGPDAREAWQREHGYRLGRQKVLNIQTWEKKGEGRKEGSERTDWKLMAHLEKLLAWGAGPLVPFGLPSHRLARSVFVQDEKAKQKRMSVRTNPHGHGLV
ncbi:hypothetical protein CSUB01_11178 [Colletotrichum sublineola]|uniref:Uncharacterized protein n=1 Tax=Colletotrichum sublineola TaxID=1173701 RepID=A0A066Y1L5_COLSU|nr:hypothetical protein CSUB01_11178 [Colletotrichum sublineola]